MRPTPKTAKECEEWCKSVGIVASRDGNIITIDRKEQTPEGRRAMRDIYVWDYETCWPMHQSHPDDPDRISFPE